MTDTTNELVDCPDCGGKLKPAHEVRLIVLNKYNTPFDSSIIPCVVCVDCGTVFYDPEKYVIGYTQSCSTCIYGNRIDDKMICTCAPPWIDPSILANEWAQPNECVNFKKKA